MKPYPTVADWKAKAVEYRIAAEVAAQSHREGLTPFIEDCLWASDVAERFAKVLSVWSLGAAPDSE